VDCLEVDGTSTLDGFILWASVERKLRAVKDLRTASPDTTVSMHLELERQRIAVDQVDVHPIHAMDSEATLKLCVKGRRTPDGAVTRLLHIGNIVTPTLPNAAGLANSITAHLRPVPRTCETVDGREIVGLERCESDVLGIY
jgi:hypothetical protein